MFRNNLIKLTYNSRPILQTCCTQRRGCHIAIVGSSGAVGATLSMLLKQSRLTSLLSCIDVAPFTLGTSLDCSHIEGRSRLRAFKGMEKLKDCVSGADIIAICASGAGPRKPGTPRSVLFAPNADVLRKIIEVTGKVAPNAILVIGSNPVNSFVPMISEIYKRMHVYDPRKIIGLSTIDTVRANRFLAHELKKNPWDVHVPVIGGHSDESIVPVFSQSIPKHNLSKEKIEKLTEKVKHAGQAVVKAKAIDGFGSSSLTMAYACCRYIHGICKAKNGVREIVESAFIRSDCHPDIKYLATPHLLGKSGVKVNFGVPTLSDYEQKLFDTAVKALKEDIKLGEDYVKNLKCH